MRVLVIGSGAVRIGQAGEFDAAGVQVLRALREEGHHVVVLTNNSASVQLTPGYAHDVIPKIPSIENALEAIRAYDIDAVFASGGGQNGLNAAVELQELFDQGVHNAKLLGTPARKLELSEDREGFAAFMIENGFPMVQTWQKQTGDDLRDLRFPALVRTSNTLGGGQSSIVESIDEAKALLTQDTSVLFEEYLRRWVEVEFEVLRDIHGNSLCVAAMENLDPVGVHTGDSMVVTPCQTIDDQSLYAMRECSLELAGDLEIVGGCNVQFAWDRVSRRFVVLEINARLSRSSTFAMKATGYPIGHVATQLILGKNFADATLPFELNPGRALPAYFEPAIDHIAVKVPIFCDAALGFSSKVMLSSRMRSVGESIGFGASFEDAFNKAWNSAFRRSIFDPSADRNEAYDPGEVKTTTISKWIQRGARDEDAPLWLDGFYRERLQGLHKPLMRSEIPAQPLHDVAFLTRLKKAGLRDQDIALGLGVDEIEVMESRHRLKVYPSYLPVDISGAGFVLSGLKTFYASYEESSEIAQKVERAMAAPSTLWLGAGPFRIGASLEFDTAMINAMDELRDDARACAVVINDNPDATSTEGGRHDVLFERPSLENVADLIQLRGLQDATLVWNFGAQLGVDTMLALSQSTCASSMNNVAHKSFVSKSETRDVFYREMEKLELRVPSSENLSLESLKSLSEDAFPSVIRLTTGLGGEHVFWCESKAELEAKLDEMLKGHEPPKGALLIKALVNATEYDVDGVGDNGELVAYTLSQKLGAAKIHPGDTGQQDRTDAPGPRGEAVLKCARTIVKGLKIHGPFNLQVLDDDGEIYVLEVNPRAGRSLSYSTLASGVQLARIGAQVLLKDSELTKARAHEALMARAQKASDLEIHSNLRGMLKAPYFSANVMRKRHDERGPSMFSTGEHLFDNLECVERECRANDLNEVS